MMNVMEILLRVMIMITKQLNSSLNMLIDLAENSAELINKAKTEKKAIVKSVLLIALGKILDLMISKNINALIELTRVINKYVNAVETETMLETGWWMLMMIFKNGIIILTLNITNHLLLVWMTIYLIVISRMIVPMRWLVRFFKIIADNARSVFLYVLQGKRTWVRHPRSL